MSEGAGEIPPTAPAQPGAGRRARRPWRRRDARSVYEEHAGPNMTPMVDVVLVILVFFMASTVILGPEFFLRAVLAEETPRDAAPAGPDLSLPPAEFLIRLEPSPSGTRATGLGLRGVGLAEMRAALAGLPGRLGSTEELLITIAPADGVPYQDVVTIHEAALDAGFPNVALR